MTARSVNEWIGATPDTPVPPRVRLRVYERQGKRCAGCSRPLAPGDKKVCDHKLALINGGENRESNLQTLGACCEPGKTRADVAQKSRSYRKRLAAAGFKKRKSRPMPGSRDSDVKITFGYGPVRRSTGEPLRRRP